MKLALVCSSGGHLYELTLLRELWKQHARFWITFDHPDAHALLDTEQVFYGHHPTNRHLLNLIRNVWLGLRLLARERPDALITTGAGLGVALIYAAKILRIRTIYIESLARVSKLSLSGRLVYPVVDRFYVQWPSLANRYRKAIYQGTVL